MIFFCVIIVFLFHLFVGLNRKSLIPLEPGLFKIFSIKIKLNNILPFRSKSADDNGSYDIGSIWSLWMQI